MSHHTSQDLFRLRNRLTREYFAAHKGQGPTIAQAAASVSANPEWKAAYAEFTAYKAAQEKKAKPAAPASSAKKPAAKKPAPKKAAAKKAAPKGR